MCVCSIWVLFEMDDEGDADPGPKWRSFRSEDELTQLIKRVVGEPLRIPPPSLAPQASEQIVSPSHQGRLTRKIMVMRMVGDDVAAGGGQAERRTRVGGVSKVPGPRRYVYGDICIYIYILSIK